LGVTTALYRRYRPENFAEVIGQEHVTEPLMQALRTGRINHAYLFSGPRGCGKTTSARILARCLNCAQGPTATPCGVCDSCVELARGGPGSLDVVEIDAASHGGVDDARDLRERATFAPARDRFKIFMLDEAHMVTPQGFNALLKIVEEPPEHVMFIFATTEPDKVIGTIRSRTHHYPFRLVSPDVLTAYLEQLCAAEGAVVGPGVLALVVRAGSGSVRDSLSVLDQLIAGADPGGLDYGQAVALLGFTPAALLDDAVEAVAASDGASAFRVVDRVISTGHEPRRFVEDLLERLRDLIVIAAAGEAAEAALRDVPADQLARMRAQAAHLGPAELSRAADLVNAALGEMTGATSPRLHLELLIARLLLPAADDAASGFAARLDRLERLDRPTPSPPTHVSDLARAIPPAGSDKSTVPLPATPAVPATPAPPTHVSDRARAITPAGSDRLAPAGPETEVLRRRWPEVLDTLNRLKKATWALVSQNAQVGELTASTLTLAFAAPGLANAFRSGVHAEMVQRAVRETLGFEVRVEGLLADAGPGAAPTAAGSPSEQSNVTGRRAGTGPVLDRAQAEASWTDEEPTDVLEAFEPGEPGEPGAAQAPAGGARTAGEHAHAEAARRAASAPVAAEDSPQPDDPDLSTSRLTGPSLVAQVLGGTVIEDQIGDPG
jgi:DNA polymerase-3 subunit gamma/tau